MIRRANADDAGLLAELGARTFYETFAADNSPEDMAAYLAASFNLAQQTAELADPASTFFIAEVGGVAAGYAMLRAGASLLPQVELSRSRRARLSVGLRPTDGRPDGAGIVIRKFVG